MFSACVFLQSCYLSKNTYNDNNNKQSKKSNWDPLVMWHSNNLLSCGNPDTVNREIHHHHHHLQWNLSNWILYQDTSALNKTHHLKQSVCLWLITSWGFLKSTASSNSSWTVQLFHKLSTQDRTQYSDLKRQGIKL